MSVARFTAIVALGSVGACFEPEAPLPVDGSGWAAHLVARSLGGRVTDLEAWSGAEPIVLSRSHDADLWVLDYEQSLAALGIPEGQVPLSRAGDRCFEAPRPLPRPGALAIFGSDATGLVPIAPDDLPALAEPILPPFDLLACTAAGGCVFGEDHTPSCSIPCAPMEVAAPARPALPELPKSTSGAPLYGCVLGEKPLEDAEACLRFDHPCPIAPDRFGPPRAEPTIYLDPEAPAGGDGSYASPFSLFDDALLAARPGETILIAAGLLDPSSGVRTGDLVLEGVCPSGTILEAALPGAALTFTQGSITLRNLRLSGRQDDSLQLVSATALLEGVLLEDGLFLNESSVELRQTVVFGGIATMDAVSLVATDLIFGKALWVGPTTRTSTVQLERVVAVGAGITIESAQLDIRDLSIIAAGATGTGMIARSSTGTLARIEIRDASETGLEITVGGACRGPSAVAIEDLTIVGGGLGPVPDTALEIVGAEVTVERVAISDRQGAGIQLGDCGAQPAPVSLADVTLARMATGLLVEVYDQAAFGSLRRAVVTDVDELADYQSAFGPLEDVRATGLGRIFRTTGIVRFEIDRYDLEALEVGAASRPLGQIRLGPGAIRGEAGQRGAEACEAGPVLFSGARFYPR